MVATSLYPFASHITSSEQLEKYIAMAKEYYINFSTSHQHEYDVIRTKDGEKNLKFPDLDNIMSLLHKQTVPHCGLVVKEERISRQTI